MIDTISFKPMILVPLVGEDIEQCGTCYCSGESGRGSGGGCCSCGATTGCGCGADELL